MENLFKQAQNAGLALERKAASEEAKVSSYDTSPDTAFYQQSEANKGIDLSGAFKGLEKLVEEEAQYQRETDFVNGKLAAQTGQALDDNASKWTTRGYKSFKRSAEVNKFVGNTIGRMDEFAEQSPAAFKQYLSETFDEMSATEDDPFIKEQMATMFTNTSNALIKQHTQAREEVNKSKTLRYARENIVSNLYANNGSVNKNVLNAIEQTKKALPEIEAYATIADSAYVAMVENGQTGLYKHLEEQGYFNKLDTQTRAQLTNTYLRVTEAKAKAAEDAAAEINAVDFVEQGKLNDSRLSTKDKQKMFKTWIDSRKSSYPVTVEGKEQQMADIMEMSVRNNFYSHDAADNIKNYITQPTTFVDGKPVFREESAAAYAAIYALKTKLGDNADYALRTFLDDSLLATIDQVNDETDTGIINASPDELRAAIMRVNAANNSTEKQELYQTYITSDAHTEDIKMLNDKVARRFGDGLFERTWATWRAYNDIFNPVAAIRRKSGEITDTAQFRGLPAKNPEIVVDAFQKAIKTEMISTKDPRIAAKRAAYTISNKTHNILGNYVVYEPVRADNTLVPISQYFGMNPGDSDDDVSEAIGAALLDCTEGDVNKFLKKNLLDADISLDMENETMRIVFDYDARTLTQKLFDRSWNPLATAEEIQTSESAENALFDVTVPVSSIRDYVLEKRRAEYVNSAEGILRGLSRFGDEKEFTPRKDLINEQDI